MGGICSKSHEEDEIQIEKARKEEEMRDKVVNQGNIEDLEIEFGETIKSIKFPNLQVKVPLLFVTHRRAV